LREFKRRRKHCWIYGEQVSQQKGKMEMEEKQPLVLVS
jgi:hypothetical protein